MSKVSRLNRLLKNEDEYIRSVKTHMAGIEMESHIEMLVRLSFRSGVYAATDALTGAGTPERIQIVLLEVEELSRLPIEP